jgi:hypothetical protein
MMHGRLTRTLTAGCVPGGGGLCGRIEEAPGIKLGLNLQSVQRIKIDVGIK